MATVVELRKLDATLADPIIVGIPLQKDPKTIEVSGITFLLVASGWEPSENKKGITGTWLLTEC